ncbi:hypothetical protein HK096_008320, partial [Nowakowskiella sp. JEL0078]
LPGLLCASKTVCANKVVLSDDYSNSQTSALQNLKESIENWNSEISVVESFKDGNQERAEPMVRKVMVVGLSWGKFTRGDFTYICTNPKSKAFAAETNEYVFDEQWKTDYFDLLDFLSNPSSADLDEPKSQNSIKVISPAQALELLDDCVDFILGSDCFFSPSIFEDCLATVAFILENSKTKVQFITSYHDRSSSRSIQYLLDRWELQAVIVPSSEFGFETDNATQTKPEKIFYTTSVIPKANVAEVNFPPQKSMLVADYESSDSETESELTEDYDDFSKGMELTSD